MKSIIFYSLLLASATATLAGCSDDKPVLTDRNLENSTEFLKSNDAAKQDIYYKPAVGFVGDPMPFYDPVAGDFKILYLQDYRPNQAVTYHPIWGCLLYTSPSPRD